MKLINRYRVWQVVVDAGLIAAAWYLAFWLRFDNGIPVYYERLLVKSFAIVIPIELIVFVLFGMYSHWWRYVSIRDMWAVVRGVTVATIVAQLAVLLINPVPPVNVPRSVIVLNWLILLGLVAGTRLLTRTIIERPGPKRLVARGKEALIIGGGDAGQLIVKEMQKSPSLGYSPIGLVDDDPRKRNLRIHGIRVLGTTEELPVLITDSKPDEVIIAIPSAAGETRQRIVNACRNAGVPVKTLPSVYELIAGDMHLARQLRQVQVEDVLGREPVSLDLDVIASYVRGQTVVVTGAGGSIGSELCRQIAAVGPERILLVEHAENSLVEIERELMYERGFRAVIPVLADVKNRSKMGRVFERYHPTVVFHAAAYKHVPLMEANPLESVRNNLISTQVVADVSVEYGVKTFVLVSTDKAVNPKNVLGQTKLLCEWIVNTSAQRPGTTTRFLAVRFGNVLGSSGSVIPLFRRQITRGGPVTVTHPDMTRYFMTIPEAVQLIVQAGAIGKSGDVFVLDMGEPVRIVELAHNMIRLSGKEPGRDIAVDFIGVRPGEKLHEELWADGEEAAPTSHPKIFRCSSRSVDTVWFDDELGELIQLMEADDTLEVVARLGSIAREPKRVPVPDVAL